MHKAALSFVTVIAVAFALCSPALARGGNSGGGGSATTTSSHATSSSGGNHQPQSQQQAASKQKSSGAGAGRARFDVFTATKGIDTASPYLFRY
jgi:hypothetical protein